MIDTTRTGAVIRKELAEFRRNRLIVVTATILPIVFLISPTASILAIHALLAAWAIWVGLAISSKVTETRVAQQLSVLGSLPPLALISLMSFQVITPSFGLAAALAGALLVIDCAACFFVARLFDRERLVTGTRPNRSAPAAAAPGTVRRLPPVSGTS
jgi:hypothetical protein